MMSCREVTELIASDALAGASPGRRMSIRFHLLMCRYCGRYAAQLKAIGRAARRAWTGDREDAGRIKAVEAALLKQVRGRPPGGIAG